MRQRGDAALGRRVAFRKGLAHTIAAGRDVDDRRALSEIGKEALRQKKWGRDAYPQGIFKFRITARIDPFHQRQGVMDQIVDAQP